MNVCIKNGYTLSNFHQCRECFAFNVKKDEFVNPELNQIDFILKENFKICSDKFFHTFEYRCEDDTKFERETSSDEVCYFEIRNGFKLFSGKSDRLHKKVSEYEKGG